MMLELYTSVPRIWIQKICAEDFFAIFFSENIFGNFCFLKNIFGNFGFFKKLNLKCRFKFRKQRFKFRKQRFKFRKIFFPKNPKMFFKNSKNSKNL